MNVLSKEWMWPRYFSFGLLRSDFGFLYVMQPKDLEAFSPFVRFFRGKSLHGPKAVQSSQSFLSQSFIQTSKFASLDDVTRTWESRFCGEELNWWCLGKALSLIYFLSLINKKALSTFFCSFFSLPCPFSFLPINVVFFFLFLGPFFLSFFTLSNSHFSFISHAYTTMTRKQLPSKSWFPLFCFTEGDNHLSISNIFLWELKKNYLFPNKEVFVFAFIRMRDK